MISTNSHPGALPHQVPLADPSRGYLAVKDDIDFAVARVFQSGRFILGEEVAAFESEFARYLGSRHAIGVANGTDALRVALIASGIEPGDEVITVANAGEPTPMAIWSVGAIPRLVDVDPTTFTMSVDQTARAIGPRTRAILPVHLYGQPADLDGLGRLARSTGLTLIEDACQAHGTRYQGRPVGTIGDVGCFSFYPTKNLGAFGDAGMVVTDNPELAERIQLTREYGWQPRNRSLLKGVNSRLDELQAAILRVKLPYLEAGNARRREIAEIYSAGLARIAEAVPGLALPVEAAGCRHIYHLYVIRAPGRDGLRRRLAADGIGTGIHYPTPTHLQPAFESYWESRPSLPITETLAGEVLSLPMFPELTDDEVEWVIECVCRALAR